MQPQCGRCDVKTICMHDFVSRPRMTAGLCYAIKIDYFKLFYRLTGRSKKLIFPFQRLIDLIPRGFRGPFPMLFFRHRCSWMYRSPHLADTSTDRRLDSDSYTPTVTKIFRTVRQTSCSFIYLTLHTKE